MQCETSVSSPLNRNISVCLGLNEDLVIEKIHHVFTGSVYPFLPVIDQSIPTGSPQGNNGTKKAIRKYSRICLENVSSHSFFPPNTDLLLSAYCSPLIYPHFYDDYVKNRTVVFMCPKLESVAEARAKLAEIMKRSKLCSLMVVHTELPQCVEIALMSRQVLNVARRSIRFDEVTIGTNGRVLRVANVTLHRAPRVRNSRTTVASSFAT